MNKKNIWQSFLLIVVNLISVVCYATTIGENAHFNDGVLQSDGSIVAVGERTSGGARGFIVVRYATGAGELDSTFNSTGIVTTQIGVSCQANSVAIQDDGNIVVGGTSGANIILARYSPTGTLDQTFGATGVVLASFNDAAYCSRAVIQSDGKIVVAGGTVDSGQPKLLVARYNSSGSLDSEFGTNGVVTTLVGVRARAESVALQSDGKIVVVGWIATDNKEQFLLVRYNSDGSLDTDFGTGGLVSMALGTCSHAQAVAIQSDNKIVVVGWNCDDGQNLFAVVRYNTDGTVDTSFGTNGVVTTSVDRCSRAYAVAIQPDGKIVVGGRAVYNLALVRYATGGALDTSFSDDGMVQTYIGEQDSLNGIFLQSDGKIAGVGYSDASCIVIRYTSDGQLDTTFGSQGVVADPGGTLSPVGSVSYLWDEKDSGVGSGTFTAGAWQTRDLNRVAGKMGNVLLSDNSITLQPGVYDIYVQAPAHAVNNHKVRLYNSTDSVIVKNGSSARASKTEEVTTTSFLQHIINVSKPTTYQIQHCCSDTRQDDGFGQVTGLGSEVYAQVKIVQKN